MTVQKLRKYLSRGFTLSKSIKAKEDSINELRALLESMNSSIHLVKVQTSLKSDRIGSIIAQIADLEEEYLHEIEKRLEQWRVSKSLIATISNDNEKIIMEDRYINTKKWQDVASSNGYSEEGVKKIDRIVLEKLVKYLKNNPIDGL